MSRLKVMFVGGLFNGVQTTVDRSLYNKNSKLTMIAVKDQNKPIIIGENPEEYLSIDVEYHHYNFHCHGPSEHPNGFELLIYFFDSVTSYK